MASFLWATFGLCLLKLCLTETQFNVSCRYGGVFHVEKNGRYSLSQPEAVELCRALNSTLATLEQLKKAHELGFETCRYGFVVGNIVIPRINPYHLCAANHTGIYKLSANTTGRYDAYCYNATETRDKACEPVERLDTSFLNNQGEIVIDNADGSRYTADGTRHSGESSTSGADDENIGSGSTHDTTPMDTSIRRSSPSYYGSVTPVSQLPDHSSGAGEREIHRKDSDDEVSPVSPDISLVTAADDVPEKDGGQYPASTTIASPDGGHHEDPTQPPLSSDMEPGQGTEGSTHPTDAPGNEVLYSTTASTRKPGDDSSLTATITESVDDVNREKATKEPQSPGTPPGSESEQANTTDSSHLSWVPGVFPDIEDHLNQLQTPLPTRSTSSIYGDQGPHKGHYESTTFPGDTTTTKIVSQRRSGQVPEWLIIVAALVALALILAVCIAVNSRRRCGQKKKLVINNGKGAVEDRKTSGLNGDASKSQEMVHLVHKEQSNDRTGACDEFLTINETQNHQEFDMKSGV
ncbi:CD44 antigen isoform X12 [Falco biarmicus]|uniref:CD44 antigen isoform X13 n=1 Tax=Falco cherrug TaxID=345164 RepID=UPI0018865BDF|nr:CD44 antigen isoform X13 [Falco cherrug]XP_037251016.1 CD44 antigen isoform X9 [Falco rusticolus]XP_056201902.1 CD44 antigen isoform X12 [Falco biarmicus]